MRILIALTYFQPHKSGLTVYAVRLAKALAQKGHDVKILTSHYDKSVPAHEIQDGVEIFRKPVMLRVSKGVIMPTLPLAAWRLIRKSDVVNLHTPQLDAAYLAMIGRILGKPVVLTYQCDLQLPKGMINRLANQISYLADKISAGSSQKIISTSDDYALNSKLLSRYLDKVKVVLAPIVLPPVTAEEVQAFKEKHHVTPGQKVIGIAARLATEKGVEYLVEAMPAVLDKYPNARVLSFGQFQNVIGEEAYAHRLMPLISDLGEHWSFLGVISDREVASFFQTCDVTVLPSVNSTEAFGMVQIESMVCGTPVVASDLPGIRQPILDSKMGRIVPPRDSKALAEAIISILAEGDCYRGNAAEIALRYSPQATAAAYETIFEELLTTNGK